MSYIPNPAGPVPLSDHQKLARVYWYDICQPLGYPFSVADAAATREEILKRRFEDEWEYGHLRRKLKAQFGQDRPKIRNARQFSSDEEAEIQRILAGWKAIEAEAKRKLEEEKAARLARRAAIFGPRVPQSTPIDESGARAEQVWAAVQERLKDVERGQMSAVDKAKAADPLAEASTDGAAEASTDGRPTAR